MGLFSKREVVSQQQAYALPPATLFKIFTDPANGCDLFGAKSYEITKGKPHAPGKMTVLAIYDAAPLAKDIPMAAAMDEVASMLEITLAEKPHRVLSHATYGTFKQQTEILFNPQGKGTLLSFETAYELPLVMRLNETGIRRVFTRSLHDTFTALAKLAQDTQALTALQRTKGAQPN